MKRNLIQLVVMVVAVTSVSCATFTGSSVASRNKAVHMIISSGNIDLINSKVARYPQFREALIGTAISLTRRKGTPVQYRYAIDHYPGYAARLRNPFDMRIKQAKKEIDRYCKALLLYKQGFLMMTGKGKKAFLETFGVPKLSEEIKIWFYIYDVVAPTFAVDDDLPSRRSVILKVVQSSYYKKPYFKTWVRHEVVRYIAQLKPDEFFKDEGSDTDRGMFTIVLGAIRDDYLREGRKGSFVIKAVWNHFLNSLGSLEKVFHVKNFISWIDASQIMPLAFRELGRAGVNRDLTANRSCSQCTTANVLRHYISLMLLGRSMMGINDLDRAHNVCPSLPATLIRYGENSRYTKQCAFIMASQSRGIRDANSLQIFLDLYGKYYRMIPSVKFAYEKQLATVMTSHLRKVRGANGLQKFLVLYDGYYHTLPSVKLAYGKVYIRVEKLVLRRIKRSTRIRATAGTRIVVKKYYYQKCVRWKKLYIGNVCVQGTISYINIWGSRYVGSCNSESRCGRHLIACSKRKAKYDYECQKYRKSAGYSKKAQDYVYVSFTIKNPTKVGLTVHLDFDHLDIHPNLQPPTTIVLAPSQRKRVLHRKKRHRYSSVRKKIRLKRYRIVSVDLHFRN